MACKFLIIALMVTLGAVGCSPSLNWRQVTVGSIQTMLPCKPDVASRKVDFPSQPLQIHMLACEADGTLFAISYAQVSAPEQASQIVKDWQQAALFKMRSSGHTQLPPSTTQTLISADGKRDNGQPFQAQFLWRISGVYIYHWAVYADKIQADSIEPMFASY